MHVLLTLLDRIHGWSTGKRRQKRVELLVSVVDAKSYLSEMANYYLIIGIYGIKSMETVRFILLCIMSQRFIRVLVIIIYFLVSTIIQYPLPTNQRLVLILGVLLSSNKFSVILTATRRRDKNENLLHNANVLPLYCGFLTTQWRNVGDIKTILLVDCLLVTNIEMNLFSPLYYI